MDKSYEIIGCIDGKYNYDALDNKPFFEFEELQNIKRDSKGRLNKGAKLAKKASCNETKIYLMYELGATVKEIIEMYGCSKSVVYRVLAKHK